MDDVPVPQHGAVQDLRPVPAKHVGPVQDALIDTPDRNLGGLGCLQELQDADRAARDAIQAGHQHDVVVALNTGRQQLPDHRTVDRAAARSLAVDLRGHDLQVALAGVVLADGKLLITGIRLAGWWGCRRAAEDRGTARWTKGRRENRYTGHAGLLALYASGLPRPGLRPSQRRGTFVVFALYHI